MPKEKTRWLSLIVYTALRIAIFALAWFLIAWLTPIKGGYAAVLAILVSGIVSIPLLSHQRDLVSVGVANFFGRMNARIDASARAEDDDADAVVSGQGDRQAEGQAVTEHE